MRLNPHGDAAIYETMVRLARGNEALLTPFVDSKGNFGKVYSRDMAYAASRYTEAKLDPHLRRAVPRYRQRHVDFVDNYDTMLEPSLLPTTYPNVLVSANIGIAVGMASNICGFNLREVCKATAAWIENPGSVTCSRSCPRRTSPRAASCCMTRRKWRKSTAPAAAASACAPAGATRKEGISLKFMRSPIPRRRRPSSTRSQSSSRRAKSARSPTCATRPTCPA